MNAHDHIISKQVQWALNRRIGLVGSQGARGRLAYTSTLDQNLFEPLDPATRLCFENGDGGELNGSPESPAKIQAVHSSSALAVNIFQYWQSINQVPVIAAACRLCRKGSTIPQKIVFEGKYPIDEKRFVIAPNIDVVIFNADSSKTKCFAIECKFTEAYNSRNHLGLKPEYLTLDGIWSDIPHIHQLARSLCPEDHQFLYLHPAQLIKHILGLKRGLGKRGFRLLYLWYDVFGGEGAQHRREIAHFSEIASADGIKFHALSNQELILRLSAVCRDDHPAYIEYISSRYL